MRYAGGLKLRKGGGVGWKDGLGKVENRVEVLIAPFNN